MVEIVEKPEGVAPEPENSHRIFIAGIFVIILLIIVAVVLYFVLAKNRSSVEIPQVVPDPGVITNTTTPVIQNDGDAVVAFTSAEDFIEYINKGSESEFFGGGFSNATGGNIDLGQPLPVSNGFEFAENIGGGAFGVSDGGGGINRVSETNVQVSGIDEPDIIKTDGNELYFSSNRFTRTIAPTIPEQEEIAPSRAFRDTYYPQYRGSTKAINVFPPTSLKEDAVIDKQGTLLLSNNQLIIFDSQGFHGYDVSDPATPKEIWSNTYQNNARLTSARLLDGNLYVITNTYITRTAPCPLEPLSANGTSVVIPCERIFHPVTPVATNSTFTVMKVNTATGAVETNTSFVGTSSYKNTIYMSENAVYVTYSKSLDLANVFIDFFLTDGRGLISEATAKRIEKLRGYDISATAKFVEIEAIFEEVLSVNDRDEQLRLETEFENSITKYAKRRLRELTATGIVKIEVPSLEILHTGSVPGTPLNQFSLDEYNGFLRIATTLSGSGDLFFGSGESENDVYVLNDKLEITGSVQGLGLTERVYAARFIGDKGYIVTFRQIDPFYVLDLSNPSNPQMKGELKIPGFSSYLHPLSDNDILGIGREGSSVKLTIFNVSDPENPTEKDTYLLSNSWSEIQSSHHAFLNDAKHNIFFLPASGNGFVFSYEDGTMKLVKSISGINATRAIFINDFFYIIGSDSIVVLNENDWSEVNRLDL